MNQLRISPEGFELEAGELLGNRFLIEYWDRRDPRWPARAVDLRHDRLPVQLSVRPEGAWFAGDPATEDWSASWPGTPPTCVLPALHCPDLRHGGGVLAATVTPYMPSGLTDLGQLDSGAEVWSEGAVITGPARLTRWLAHLQRLYQASAVLEPLHTSRQAHGALSAMDFRVEPEGRIVLRPAPWISEASPSMHTAHADLAALQSMAVEHAPRRSSAVDFGFESADGRHVYGLLRAVLHRRFRSGGGAAGVVAWREALHRLIHALAACLLSASARTAREAVLTRLIGGQMDHALNLASASTDPWCRGLQQHLETRWGVVHAEYVDWTGQDSTQPLLERVEQLLMLMHRGFALPSPPPTPGLSQRLATCELHLREAARAIRERSWQQARSAMGAAACLDPANTEMAALIGILPSDFSKAHMASVDEQPRTHARDPLGLRLDGVPA